MPALDSSTKLLIQHNGFNAQSKAIFFDGSGDRLTTPDHADWDFGTGAFTLEAWVRPATAGDMIIMDVGAAVSGSAKGVWLRITGANVETYVNSTLYNWAFTHVANKWFHIAVVRQGTGAGQYRAYINGKAIGSALTSAENITGSTEGVSIGFPTVFASSYFNGHMKQVRISNIARYTSDFTPSTAQFAADANTKLLLLGEETNGAVTFTDSETTPKTITTVGNCVLQFTADYRESNFIDTESLPKLITDSGDSKIVSQAFNKSAGFYAGSGAPSGDNPHTIIPMSPDWNFRTDNYTVELWVMPITIGANNMPITRNRNTGGGDWEMVYTSSNITWGHNGTLLINVSHGGRIVANKWSHLAAVRVNGVVNLYVDGVSVGSATSAADITGNNTDVVNVGSDKLNNWGVNGWIKEVRVSKGIARYTGTFTPSTTPFTAEAAVTTKAIAFDGTGDYLTAPDHADWDFGTGDFTLECWARFNTVTSTFFIERGVGAGDDFGLRHSTGASALDIYVNGVLYRLTTWTAVANRWYHIAASRSGTSLRGFIDGVQVNATQVSSDNVSSARGITVGAGNSGATEPLNGWMKNVRISNIARYTAAFIPTPVHTLLTNDANTKLLLLGDESVGATTFVDSETTPKTLTTFGNTILQSITAESNKTKLLLHFDTPATAPLAPAIRFDGTGDSLTVPVSTDWRLGTGDFTLEGWFRFNTVASSFLIDVGGGLSDGGVYLVLASAGTALETVIAGTTITSSPSISPIANRWYHFAVTRHNGQVRFFSDGNQLGNSTANTGIILPTVNGAQIGKAYHSSASQLNGWSKNVRISRVARYVASFTPSQDGFISDSDTLLLVKGDENNGATSFVDSSSFARTITTIGDTKISYEEDHRSNVFKDSSITDDTALTSAIRFDGSGAEALTLADHADWDFPADFTIEAWIRVVSFSPNQFCIVDRNNSLSYSLVMSSSQLAFYVSNALVSQYSFVPILNRWYHVALSRSGTIIKLFLDGEQVDSDTYNTAISFADVLNVGNIANGSQPSNGWIRNLRISNSARYTTSFVPSPVSTNLTDDANTKLLITGSITGGNGQSKAIRFDGTGDYLSLADHADWDFGTGDFTIEFWARMNTVVTNGMFIDVGGQTAAGNIGVRINVGNASQLQWRFNLNTERNDAFTWVANRWYHIAISRASGTARSFIDGALIGSYADTTNITGGTAGTRIGFDFNLGFVNLNGWMKNIRITNGLARYTAAFTPSEAAFVDDGNTRLLVQAEEAIGATTFVDGHTTPKTITSNGDVIIQQTPDYRNRIVIDRETTPKLITTLADVVIENQIGIESKHPYSLSTMRAKVDFISVFGNGSSIYDGSGDFLTVADHADLDYGTGAFAVELWVRFRTDQDAYLFARGNGTVNNGPDILRSVSAGTLRLYIANVLVINNAWTPLMNHWYHLMGTRSGGTAYLFVNGTLFASAASTGDINYSTSLNIGGASAQPSIGLIGMLDNIRLSNVVRQTATHNPPTEDITFGATGNMLLLI